MNFSKLRENPLSFNILLGAYFLITVMMVLSFVGNLQYAKNVTRPLLTIAVWLFVCFGFYRIKKWAWAAIFVLIAFSILNFVHLMATGFIGFNLMPVISIVIGGLIIWD